jgi:hypothetical protein
MARLARRCDAGHLAQQLPEMSEVQPWIERLNNGEAIALLLSQRGRPSFIIVAEDHDLGGTAPVFRRAPHALSWIKLPSGVFENGWTGNRPPQLVDLSVVNEGVHRWLRGDRNNREWTIRSAFPYLDNHSVTAGR